MEVVPFLGFFPEYFWLRWYSPIKDLRDLPIQCCCALIKPSSSIDGHQHSRAGRTLFAENGRNFRICYGSHPLPSQQRPTSHWPAVAPLTRGPMRWSLARPVRLVGAVAHVDSAFIGA
ncbi:hypothetical protein BS78_07G129600 [Paspalum vaginatum]|nr:hypothetical protein BS78_07G129600 [Paspalum vaginatum]